MRRVDIIDTFPIIHMLNGQLSATASLKLRPVHRQRSRILIGPDRGPLLWERVRYTGSVLFAARNGENDSGDDNYFIIH